jgi:hypothetical protein
VSRNIWDVAVQQAQQYYRRCRTFGLIALTAAMATATPSFAGITGSHMPDPLLDGAVSGPCDPRLDGPDYVPDVDVMGKPVVRADVPAARQPVPAEMLVPLGPRGRGSRSRQGPIASLDGKTLDPILNPKPACLPRAR